MTLSYIKDITNFIFLSDPLKKCDAIFLPGNAYPYAAQEAARLYIQGLADWIVPSGRYSVTEGVFSGAKAQEACYKGPYETEWAFMRDVLLRSGVPDSAIVREEEATYTWQNALFTAAAIEREGINVKSAIICCKPYHARRCRMYYETALPGVALFMHPVQAYGLTRENWTQSAEGIDGVMGELARCGVQFGAILKEKLLDKAL